MSVPVQLDDLPDMQAAHPWGYLVTVADDGRPRMLAVPFAYVDGTLRLVAGERTRANAAARPLVSMVFPPAEIGGYSLIVDGTARLDADGDGVSVQPTAAVLHRPAR